MTIVVGELINTSRKQVRKAVEEKDTHIIREIAKTEIEAGADYIDVNCGTMMEKEPEIMQWLLTNVQHETDIPVCIDTPNIDALKAGLEIEKSGKILINSITMEKNRYDNFLPLVLEHSASVVALCEGEKGLPDSIEERLTVARQLISRLIRDGVPQNRIYLDLMVKPLSTSDKAALELTGSVSSAKKEFPDIHFICGMSNISYGLPVRKIINRAFLVQAMAAGMDGFILDPLDTGLMSMLYAAQALLGQDPFCGNYIKAYRKGIIGL